MSIITHYVLWIGHDAAGTLPPVDVVAGVVRPGSRRLPVWWPPVAADETVVFVPAQWIGEWDDGYTLAPAYQYLWRVSMERLQTISSSTGHSPYRPERLPETAAGPRKARRGFRYTGS
jgi:hypothetical protein